MLNQSSRLDSEHSENYLQNLIDSHEYEESYLSQEQKNYLNK